MGDLNTPWCGVAVSDGGRYQLETTGLRIMDITPSDSGEYRCAGEMEGIYEYRTIIVRVHTAGKAAFTLMHRPKYKLLKIMVHSYTCTCCAGMGCTGNSMYFNRGDHTLTYQCSPSHPIAACV